MLFNPLLNLITQVINIDDAKMTSYYCISQDLILI